MTAFVSLALALAVGTVTASPLPQGIDPTGSATPMPSVCSSTYTSAAGDTCASIGAKFGLSATQIQSANTFLNCDDIWTWTPVCIPAGATTSSSTTASTPSSTCVATYTAVSGDTCASIGAKYGLTEAQVLAANTFLNCNDIWAWTPVCIPQTSTPPPPTCVTTYTSQAGDTCESIESKFGLPVGAIKASNDFVTCNDIWQYTPICIPPGGITVTATLPTTTVTATTTTSSGSTASPCASVYIAQAGDTCTSIVKGSRSEGRQIYLSNPTLDCNHIPAGTQVCINQYAYSYIQTATPTPIPTCAKTHTAVAGDTCQSISRTQSYDLAAADIASANSFVNCDDIWAGTQLCIPQYTSVPYCKHIIHASAGESCFNLSRPYKIGGSDIMAVTPGLECGDDEFGNSNAYEGQEICIPWSTFY
ncbi:SubName: Full=Uncharacterized protein {ECO:0000313/EMBL:CCA74763.1} [Serendipita indica DSM 11827]|uniref:LysM domain-containing protein n=1 Tax=Serendipita indica (strain DSM 11827) TaxID=1109443 RepID=G4TTX0_SERID|nr:SubName: Full=Uncharacterized protein {ECO:0000313/EMBL:CCA74763.1} [Serendipita indica DSM 11827]CCA74763.1 hypothetical protein PIIN_08721 [Serendipita indica DSM 11827]